MHKQKSLHVDNFCHHIYVVIEKDLFSTKQATSIFNKKMEKYF